MPEKDNSLNADGSINPFQQTTGGLLTDSEYLIQQAFKVDVGQGYELLFRRYHKVLCNQAVRFTYSRDAAEDIVADVFMGFWKNKVHDHLTTSYRAYLYRAVRNRVYNYLQEEFRRDTLLGKPVDLAAADQITDEDPQRIIQFAELSQRLETEIKRLPPQCQRVFVLSRFEGRKQREIADELQISLKAVEAHIQRALVQLRKVLDTGILIGVIGWLLR